ncbi:MAG: TetR/AcrR family transcriptional regulator [Lachnospiraceae bacterium]|nr:TetR/AcrR family transcriptional regulator [Lachnospiraceae bacterium]
MSNTTKSALEASLKKLLLQKPIDKITINDLASDCGISRMAFYYHFKDIYDLVEWSCVEDGKKALQDKKTYDTWQEGMNQVFEAVLENKPFILNVYRSVSREKIESYLYKLTYQLIADVVEEKCEGIDLADEDKSFIAEFYKYGFVGIMLDWIGRGMKDDYHKIVDRMSITLHGNITNSIHNFEQLKKRKK